MEELLKSDKIDVNAKERTKLLLKRKRKERNLAHSLIVMVKLEVG